MTTDTQQALFWAQRAQSSLERISELVECSQARNALKESIPEVLRCLKGSEEPEAPSTEALALAQHLMGAVMPTAMLYTSWPGVYFDMMRMADILQRRHTPAQLFELLRQLRAST